MRKQLLVVFFAFFAAPWPAVAQDQAAAARAAPACGPSQVLCEVKTDDSKQPVGQPEEQKALALPVTLESGKTYDIRLNFIFQRWHLELADEAEGHFLSDSSLHCTWQPKKK